ncbi:MAG TPA: C39 family peptidase [Patescibacteria group bacterium]|nr:C39 family peptidase [Patescibacteria group bacterium]
MTEEYVGYRNVPSYSQTTDYLEQEGSLTTSQIEDWNNSLCGLICASMVTDQLSGEEHTLAELLHAATKSGAYDSRRGWIHKKLASLLKEFGINGNAQRINDLDSLYSLLEKNSLVMASVSPFYLNPERKNDPSEKNGHLVLIVGMSKEPTSGYRLFINDPSSEHAAGGSNISIEGDVFRKSFSGNTIAFKSSK